MSQDDSTQPPGSEDWTQEDSGATTLVRRGRGKRGKTMAKDIVNMPSGEKICIGVNKYGQANSTRTAKIATWIGLLAKNTDLLPLTYPDWRKVPQVYKDDACAKVMEKFDIPESSRSWILEKLCARWRDYKSLLKSEHFNKYETDSERMANIDLKCMSKEQWEAMFKMWGDNNHLELSQRNKDNKAKQIMRHTTGSTSFAVLRERKINIELSKRSEEDQQNPEVRKKSSKVF
ncbi:uncharacterized protein LOC122638649 [Telopea speciosissima]|uniref:uncharacterized protein LOC122638649 n=1 Tax=Telopea speciosissima TaxID=54955 RepID=UPI001CC64152|nr:uncharacterized protein LOC122638649 [Telopea speciosissima]